MAITVLETMVDPAGKYRVRVQAQTGSTLFFKFQTKPTEEDIEAAYAQYVELNTQQAATESQPSPPTQASE